MKHGQNTERKMPHWQVRQTKSDVLAFSENLTIPARTIQQYRVDGDLLLSQNTKLGSNKQRHASESSERRSEQGRSSTPTNIYPEGKEVVGVRGRV